MMILPFPFYKQQDQKDCGPTCLKIIAEHYKKAIPIQKLRDFCETTREGSSMMGLSDAAEAIGFRTIGVKMTFGVLQKETPLPCVVHWNKNPFAVVYKIKKGQIYISDPAIGLLKYTKEEFLSRWIGNNADDKTQEGVALLLEPTPKLYQDTYEEEKGYGIQFVSKYLFQYKRLLIQLIIGLTAASLLQLVFPFLTQSIVDVGIQNQDIQFVYLILIAQLFLFFGRTALEIIRSWILLHISARINISLISDFFIKLMNLPISFFDVRMTGDIMQRINDHKRIERILTTSSLNVLFSFLNMFVFGLVLVYYSLQIFLVFLVGSILVPNRLNSWTDFVNGTISNLAALPSGDVYQVQVALDNGLTTSYNSQLEYSPEMTATAEVITEDLRLIERLFNSLRSIFDN